MKNISKLAINHNINSQKEFIRFCNLYLPDKEKFPFLFESLKFTADKYFENSFKTSNPYFPLIEPCISKRNIQIKNGIMYQQVNLIKDTFSYTLKLFLNLLIKNGFMNIDFKKCSLAYNSYKKRDYYSSNLIIKINFLKFKKKYFFNQSHYFHKLVKKTIVNTISPFTTLLILFLIIPMKINYCNIQKLKKGNLILYKLIEFSLRHDFNISKIFIKNINLIEFRNTGWCTVKGSILFEIFQSLKIKSIVEAHGHLSAPSLSLYYPIKSDQLIVVSQEEKLRLEEVDKFLFNQNKKINCVNQRSKSFIDIIKLKQELKCVRNIIFVFSGSDILKSNNYFDIYHNLLTKFLNKKYSVFYRPHHEDNKELKRLASLNYKLRAYKDSVELINIKNTLVLGANTTFLLETHRRKILTLQISDFCTCVSSNIKNITSISSDQLLLSMNLTK